MIVYAESSAVVAWLLGEDRAEAGAEVLQASSRVVASVLTGAESRRVLVRAAAGGMIERTQFLAATRLLESSEATWTTLEVTGAVLARAGQPFPVEPVRTLDALHLATALEFAGALPSLTVVSFDSRVRENAEALGLRLLP